MNKSSNWLSFFLLFWCFSASLDAQACSMYKLTEAGVTMVGTNEDAWRTTPHIWFETGKNGTFGCCFTGSRSIGNNKYAAQSGMNEHGLTFSRLASYHPEKQGQQSKKKIGNPDVFLMDLMKTCKNIDDVYDLFNQFDRTCYLNDVFVYIEPSGDYLIVEPYRLIRGNDQTLVQANFCPSITAEKDRRNQARYRDGKDLLRQGFETSLDYCTRLSKEMHVCRDKVGDGTLLTAIWDTKNKKVTLYFYHDYSENRVFDLHIELAKGDHQMAIDALFKENKEFEQLKNYITPFNTDWIRIVLAVFGLIFLVSSIYFAGSLFKSSSRKNRAMFALLFVVLNLGFSYMFVLATTMDLYYFSAPYHHFNSVLKSMSSYVPFLMVVFLIGIAFLHLRNNYFEHWSTLSKWMLGINCSLLLLLVPAFLYWGLLSL